MVLCFYTSFYSSFYPSFYHSFYPSFYSSLFLFLLIFLSIIFSSPLSIPLSINLSIPLSIPLSVPLSLFLYFFLSLYSWNFCDSEVSLNSFLLSIFTTARRKKSAIFVLSFERWFIIFSDNFFYLKKFFLCDNLIYITH